MIVQTDRFAVEVDEDTHTIHLRVRQGFRCRLLTQDEHRHMTLRIEKAPPKKSIREELAGLPRGDVWQVIQDLRKG